MHCAIAKVHVHSLVGPSELDSYSLRTLDNDRRPVLGRGLWVPLGLVEPKAAHVEQSVFGSTGACGVASACLSATLCARDCTEPSHVLVATTPATVPEVATLPVGA